MANEVDIVALRKKQKRLRRLGKLIIFLVALGIAAFLYSKRDVWFPELKGIGTKYQSVTQNDAAGGDGYFPLHISAGLEYSADFVNNRLFLLCDKYLYIYGADGSQKDSRQHGYSNPIMKTSHSRCLLYSCGGYSFRVDTAGSMLYENILEQSILFASISEEGYVVVVTESETYACRLSVYDMTGKSIYYRECVDRITDICLTKEGCITASIDAENGEMITVLRYFTFDGEPEKWSTMPLPTFCWKLYATSDGGACVIGDSKCAYYSSEGALLSAYDFSGTMTDCTFSNDNAAIILKNESRRKTELLLFSDPNSAPVSVEFNAVKRDVILEDDRAYVLGTDTITGYSLDGSQLDETKIEDAYEKILKNGRYFYLLGYDSVNRTEH